VFSVIDFSIEGYFITKADCGIFEPYCFEELASLFLIGEIGFSEIYLLKLLLIYAKRVGELAFLTSLMLFFRISLFGTRSCSH
jgi:hypothetical protein